MSMKCLKKKLREKYKVDKSLHPIQKKPPNKTCPKCGKETKWGYSPVTHRYGYPYCKSCGYRSKDEGRHHGDI